MMHDALRDAACCMLHALDALSEFEQGATPL
jgi:hypothetical protein